MTEERKNKLMNKKKADLVSFISFLEDSVDRISDFYDFMVTYAIVMNEDRNYCMDHGCSDCVFKHECEVCRVKAYQLKGEVPDYLKNFNMPVGAFWLNWSSGDVKDEVEYVRKSEEDDNTVKP